MSYGTRQKLGVLLALLGAPALVVLDETFNGLDPASGLLLKRHLRDRVDAGRCGVVLATHALDIAEHWADRVALLHEAQWLVNETSGPWASRAQVHQATGMVIAQLQIPSDDALALLRRECHVGD